MKQLAFAALLALASGVTWANEQLACQASNGSYLTGTVVRGPRFAHGQFRRGVELSHTHLAVRADQDGRTYDVAIDNVFANGYDARQAGVPAPIGAIKVNDRLELCGELYDKGIGIHFVHPNCGAAPSPHRPDGWIKKLAKDGSFGPNLEGNTAFCSLFGNKRGR
jgi:hypothetical protein